MVFPGLDRFPGRLLLQMDGIGSICRILQKWVGSFIHTLLWAHRWWPLTSSPSNYTVISPSLMRHATSWTNTLTTRNRPIGIGCVYTGGSRRTDNAMRSSSSGRILLTPIGAQCLMPGLHVGPSPSSAHAKTTCQIYRTQQKQCGVNEHHQNSTTHADCS